MTCALSVLPSITRQSYTIVMARFNYQLHNCYILLLAMLQYMSSYLSKSVLPALLDKQGEYLLRELVKRSNNHNVMNKWMQKFFMYLVSYLSLRKCMCLNMKCLLSLILSRIATMLGIRTYKN